MKKPSQDEVARLLALNCTLKAGRKKSSTDKLLREVIEEFERHNIRGEILRVADYNVKPGVKSDEGKGDEWSLIRRKILDADRCDPFRRFVCGDQDGLHQSNVHETIDCCGFISCARRGWTYSKRRCCYATVRLDVGGRRHCASRQEPRYPSQEKVGLPSSWRGQKKGT